MSTKGPEYVPGARVVYAGEWDGTVTYAGQDAFGIWQYDIELDKGGHVVASSSVLRMGTLP